MPGTVIRYQMVGERRYKTVISEEVETAEQAIRWIKLRFTEPVEWVEVNGERVYGKA